MRIAVNTRFLQKDFPEGYGYFLHETFKRITTAHPEHEFIFIFDRPYDPQFIFSPNTRAVVCGPPARHPVLWKLWYDFRIPLILKKTRADLFVSCDGFCSLATAIPQCLVVHDLSWIHFPSFISKSHLLFYKYYTPKYLQKAARVATVSHFSKKDLITQYGIGEDKIDVVFSAAKTSFHPATGPQMTVIKEKYTNGNEYFLYTGAIHPRKNLFNLLKSFSIFKKKQNSNFKLLMAGRLAWKYDQFVKDLQRYKYRKDVILAGYLPEEELVQLMSAAYALVYPSFWEGFGVPVLEAMRSGVPVITSVDSAMQEIAGDAALYANPASPEDIADKMMLIYKDEQLRTRLIQKGIGQEKKYSWDRTASLLWETILKSAGRTEQP
ncbi:MAG TPA: glycosyltransferase family 1 protein [Chitinophagaceae bacterium]|nr:glycosyltransferase family 1 protein [Chitinophagaceae bacterium]